jgi:hypothetical protein
MSVIEGVLTSRLVGAGVQVDLDTREVCVGGRLVELTATEFSILSALYERENKVVTYEQLMKRVWGWHQLMDKRAMEVQVSRLRSKLGESGDRPRLIRTIRGVGYRFVNNDAAGLLASFTWDLDLIVVQAHIFDNTVFGVVPDDVIGSKWVVPGSSWSELTHEERVAMLRQMHDLNVHHWESDFPMAKPDGSPFVSHLCARLLSADGELLGVTGDFRIP